MRLVVALDGRRWDSRRLSRWGYLRRRAYAVVAVCLCLACCPVWPEPSCRFVGTRTDTDGAWIISWSVYGEVYEVKAYDRGSMRVLDAILWSRGRR